MDSPSLAALHCPSPIARFYIDSLFHNVPVTLRGVKHPLSDPASKEVESFCPFHVCNAFNARTLSCLLKLQFIQQEDLVLEDRVALNQYQSSSDYIRTWFVRGPWNPTRQDRTLWKLAYARFWETKRRSIVNNDQSPIMIHIETGKRVSIQSRMNTCEGTSRDTIRKYRLVTLNNTHIKSKKRPQTFPRNSREEYWHDVAIQTLRVREKPSRGRSRCGTDFFGWKRGVWTPGGSPLQRPLLGGGADEDEQSECGPVRRLSNRQSNRWHPYAA
ncbi:hypothetical protein BDZ89DRAFT_1066718 [Hymenopellis radicata]|nr:hypothetical protein BDZ89DRAFT_1066718 [Hymenopellis radicata]